MKVGRSANILLVLKNSLKICDLIRFIAKTASRPLLFGLRPDRNPQHSALGVQQRPLVGDRTHVVGPTAPVPDPPMGTLGMGQGG